MKYGDVFDFVWWGGRAGSALSHLHLTHKNSPLPISRKPDTSQHRFFFVGVYITNTHAHTKNWVLKRPSMRVTGIQAYQNKNRVKFHSIFENRAKFRSIFVENWSPIVGFQKKSSLFSKKYIYTYVFLNADQ